MRISRNRRPAPQLHSIPQDIGEWSSLFAGSRADALIDSRLVPALPGTVDKRNFTLIVAMVRFFCNQNGRKAARCEKQKTPLNRVEVYEETE